MPHRNPFIPSERAKDLKEHTSIDQKEAKRELSKQHAEEERRAHQHPEPTGEEEEFSDEEE